MSAKQRQKLANHYRAMAFQIAERFIDIGEYAEDAYWANLVSLFRVTSMASCEFLSDFYGKKYVPITDLWMMYHVGIQIIITGYPEVCLI